MGGPVCMACSHSKFDGNGTCSGLSEEEKQAKCLDVVTLQGSSAHRHPDGYYCEKDLNVQIETRFVFCYGCHYFPDMNSPLAKQSLKHCAVGTFLIRDSSDPKYLYTISVKTKRGPTSIRISYERGHFSLDADEMSKSQMPKFSSLFELIDFYIRKSNGKKSERCRFLDKSGKKDLPIILLKPKLNDVPSLMHLSRTLINRSLPAAKSSEIATFADRLPLPKPLVSYIKDYPYLY